MPSRKLTRALSMPLSRLLVPTPEYRSALAAALTYATWNQADADAGIALSGGDLIVGAPAAGWVSVRATIGKLTGDWSYLVDMTGSINKFFGFGVEGALPDYPGIGGNLSWGLSNGGYIASPNSLASSGLSNGAIGDMLVVLKRSTSQILYYLDGSDTPAFTQNIAAADGQVLIPLASVYFESGSPANFGATSLGVPIPPGVNEGVYTS